MASCTETLLAQSFQNGEGGGDVFPYVCGDADVVSMEAMSANVTKAQNACDFSAECGMWYDFTPATGDVDELHLKLDYSVTSNGGTNCDISDSDHTRLDIDYSIDGGSNWSDAGINSGNDIVPDASGSIDVTLGTTDPLLVRVRIAGVAYSVCAGGVTSCDVTVSITNIRLETVTVGGVARYFSGGGPNPDQADNRLTGPNSSASFNNVTVAGWFKDETPSDTDKRGMIGRGFGSGNGWMLYKDGSTNELVWYVYGVESRIAMPGGGNWFYVAVVKNGSTDVKWYVGTSPDDLTLVATDTVNTFGGFGELGTYGEGVGWPTWGQNSVSGLVSWKGWIDDPRMWTAILSLSDLQIAMNPYDPDWSTIHKDDVVFSIPIVGNSPEKTLQTGIASPGLGSWTVFGSLPTITGEGVGSDVICNPVFIGPQVDKVVQVIESYTSGIAVAKVVQVIEYLGADLRITEILDLTDDPDGDGHPFVLKPIKYILEHLHVSELWKPMVFFKLLLTETLDLNDTVTGENVGIPVILNNIFRRPLKFMMQISRRIFFGRR